MANPTAVPLPPLRLVAALGLLSALALGLSGCAGFFVCQKASCPAAASATSTGDYGYVANNATSDVYVSGFSLQAGTLAAATGSPFNLGFIPSAMVVTPNDEILYVADAQTSYIYAYSIGTGGALSLLNSGPVAQESANALAVSPDGNYLFVLDPVNNYMQQWAINSTNGGLTSKSLTPFAVGSTLNGVAVAPSGDFVAVALGATGVQIYPYAASTGTLSAPTGNPFTPSSPYADFSVAIDANNNVYATQTNGLLVIPVSTAGAPTVTSVTPIAVGNGPRAVVVGKNSNYLYVANSADSTISGFSISGSTLTSLGGAIAAPAAVTSLAIDSTGGYLLAAGYSTGTGLELFSIGAGGGLTNAGTAATGNNTTIPSAIAIVH